MGFKFINQMPISSPQRYCVTLTVATSLVFLTNAWRLGRHVGALCVIAFIVLGILALFAYPIFRFTRLSQRPAPVAFVLGTAYLACFSYVAAGFFTHVPFKAPALMLGIVLFWLVLFRYWRIIRVG